MLRKTKKKWQVTYMGLCLKMINAKLDTFIRSFKEKVKILEIKTTKPESEKNKSDIVGATNCLSENKDNATEEKNRSHLICVKTDNRPQTLYQDSLNVIIIML